VLRTEVVDILRREMVALRPLGRTAAYDAIMNQPTMLDGCLRLFRSQPQLFAAVVVDAGRQPVTADDRLLRCGRTLAEVVALVVRAAARRVFRARLSPGPGRARPDSASERLYRALRD